MKVLDVGCGPGWITYNYAKNGANVYSIDLTETSVGLAKAFLKMENLTANVQVGDAEKIPFLIILLIGSVVTECCIIHLIRKKVLKKSFEYLEKNLALASLFIMRTYY